MRRLVSAHAPVFAALAVMLVVFVAFAAVIGPGLEGPPRRVPATVAQPIDLPGPGEDMDNDTYADEVDLWEGDLVVVLDVLGLSVPGDDDVRPYLLVGTQDDHWRTGEGAQLEWVRVVDHDPLGLRPGSPEWIEGALRTGMWWRSIPMEGESHAIAERSVLRAGDGVGAGPGDRNGAGDGAENGAENGEGVTWPQRFVVNVRDDRALSVVELEVWDSATRPHARLGAWSFEVDVLQQRWRLGGGEWVPAGQVATQGTVTQGQRGLEVALDLESDLEWETKRSLAERWAPLVFFEQGERFFPTRGDALERFFGFSDREADHRTWDREFNNGRHGYRLLLGDFTGDGTVGHEDAAVHYDVLRAGGVAADTVYANVMRTTMDHVVVQYWFIYMYNYVLDETGRDIPALAHAGDREFIQLVFKDVDAAIDGTPLRTAYSQHYKGVSIPFMPGEPPFHVDADRPAVFVALGSHASYPAAGTDEALRHALQGFGDVFHGEGEHWGPEDYELEVLGPQTWHAGYLWGPLTRHSRDMGTTARPLLQYDFTYPFTDPLHWESALSEAEADRLLDLYGGEP